MRKSTQPANALFGLLGLALVTLSLFTGCAWSVEGENFKINAPPEDSEGGTRGV